MGLLREGEESGLAEVDGAGSVVVATGHIAGEGVAGRVEVGVDVCVVTTAVYTVYVEVTAVVGELASTGDFGYGTAAGGGIRDLRDVAITEFDRHVESVVAAFV